MEVGLQIWNIRCQIGTWPVLTEPGEQEAWTPLVFQCTNLCNSLDSIFLHYGPFTPNHIGWPSDGHRIAIGWTFYRMGSVPNFFNGWNLFLKDSINEHRFESFYAYFILFLLCCVIYFPLLTWHFQSSLNLISILSASDVCECCIVLYKNPFCPMAIRCPSDEKYFWCEGAITEEKFLEN